MFIIYFGSSGSRCQESVWCIRCLLGINVCERKWAEAELGWGRSWNAMQVQPNLSRPGNEKCRMACGGAHVRLPWLGLHTCTRSRGTVPGEGLNVTQCPCFWSLPCRADSCLLSLTTPTVLGRIFWVLHDHVQSDTTAAWGRERCPLSLTGLFRCKLRKQPRYRLCSQTA